MSTLRDLLHAPTWNPEAAARLLDGLDHGGRLAEIRALSSADERLLYDVSAGARPLTLGHFVPESTPPGTEVIHDGWNSLLMFRGFQKRFARPPLGEWPDTTDVAWGYNHQLWAALTGPGSFVLRRTPLGLIGGNDAPMVIDYRTTPPASAPRPAGWPRVIAQTARLGFIVYAHMCDFMRGVSEHVSVGCAWRFGAPRGNWFVLARRDAA